MIEDDKIQNYTSAASVDYGFSQISSSWTQISTMQQNAGILLSILIFTITIIFGYITNESFSTINNYEKILILLLAFVSIVFAITAFVFLLKIIRPKKTELPINASKYQKLMNQKIEKYEEKCISMSYNQKQDIVNTFTVEIVSKYNDNLTKIISKNQENYGFCLNSCIISFFSSCSIIVFILLKFFGFCFKRNVIFGIFITFMLILCYLIIKLILNRSEE